MILLNWKLRLQPHRFGLLVPLNQQAKKGVSVLAGVTGPGHREERGLLLHNRGEEESIWNIGDPLGLLLVLSCLVIKVNGKVQQPDPGETTTGPEPS